MTGTGFGLSDDLQSDPPTGNSDPPPLATLMIRGGFLGPGSPEQAPITGHPVTG